MKIYRVYGNDLAAHDHGERVTSFHQSATSAKHEAGDSNLVLRKLETATILPYDMADCLISLVNDGPILIHKVEFKDLTDRRTRRRDKDADVCVICNGDIDQLGSVDVNGNHNASPVKPGRCCSFCNEHAVLPKRFQNVQPRPVVNG